MSWFSRQANGFQNPNRLENPFLVNKLRLSSFQSDDDDSEEEKEELPPLPSDVPPVAANKQLSDNTTALHLAAKNGHVGAVEMLIAGGAYPTPVDTLGRTPLGYAVENMHEECEDVLRNAGASINERDEW
jgi:hypothetical protein